MTGSAKTTIAVLMGGISTEHEISLKSGSNVVNTLVANHDYTVLPVVITPQGLWHIADRTLSPGESFSPNQFDAATPVNTAWALQSLYDNKVDAAFVALHGKGGEDGQIQGFLQTADIPFTGSGVLGNAICMDKILTKRVLQQSGLPVAKDIVVDCHSINERASDILEQVISDIGFPCVIKISDQGSSHNVSIAENASDMLKALEEFQGAGEQILIEEFIDGRELTCAVIDSLEHGPCFALPPTELRPVESKWFDYHAKYTPGATEEITPAPIDTEFTLRVQQLASACHKLMHCAGMSRTDMFLKGDSLYIIEINTVPGLTETSLIPQAAAAAGISFGELLDILIKWALQNK